MNAQYLRENGIDYEDGAKRFSGNQMLYEKYLQKLSEQTMFDEMKEAVDRGDAKTAFESVHKMKAFVGNLSITKLYQQVCELTELFRSGTVEGCNDLVQQTEAELNRVISTIKESKTK